MSASSAEVVSVRTGDYCFARGRRWIPIAAFRFLAILAPWLASGQPYTNTAVFLENQKQGTSTWQLTQPAGSGQIEGYASLTSVNRGGQISFLVNTTNSSYSLEVYRIGWYGGAGGRSVFGPVTVPGTVQAIPPVDPLTRLVECNWTNPYTLAIPATADDATDWASGVYLAKLTGDQDGAQSYIIFAVRDDNRPSDLLAAMSVTTYQAYNDWGGASLYDFQSKAGQATKVSFDRPFTCLDCSSKGSGDFFGNLVYGSAGWECNLVRWLEREGYDVSYCTSLDVHANTNLLWSHKGFISMGHDEYWSYPMRWNVQAARDRGVNLAFLSSDTCDWQVRFEPSTVDGTPNRNMVCYKSTADPLFKTPSNYLTTVHFRDPPVLNSEASLLGVTYGAQAGIYADMVVADPTHWVFANAGLQAGQRFAGILGYEVETTNYFAPAGLSVACASPFLYYRDQNIPPTLAYSHATSYNTPGGATVFAAGSMQWTWGLDDFNAPRLRPSYQNPAVQQITRNILARMLNQPAPSPTLFYRADTSTAGNWKLRYGVEGCVLPDDSTNLPTYASFDISGGAVAEYPVSGSDPNSLQRVSTTGRYLAGWSSPTNFTLDLSFRDGQNHQVALYFWDWNNAGRTQLVEVVDASTTNLLDRRTIAGFTSGQWWAWQIGGHVQFRFSNLSGPDCLANALAFGSGAAVQFVGQDLLTQGNWQPYYGADGAYVAGDAPSPPAYLNVHPLDGRLSTWSLASTDPRAPVPPVTTNQVFAAWGASGNSLNTFDLNPLDNAWHQVAIYCVDADYLGRTQLLSLLDTANNTVLDSRTLTNFGGGTYLVYNFRGPIQVRLQSLGAARAVISALLFGPPNQPPAVALTAPVNSQAFTLPTTIVLTANATDPDGWVSQVSIYANSNWLATVTNAPFTYNWADPLVGQYTLTAVATDNRMAMATSQPVSITVNLPTGYQPPQVWLTSPPYLSAHPVPSDILMAASATNGTAPLASLQFVVDDLPFGPPLTVAPFSLDATNLFAGSHSIRARVTDAFGVAVTSSASSVFMQPPAASATFRLYDYGQRGNWQGVCGTEGYIIINFATNLPSYAVAVPTGNSAVTWAHFTFDARALQKPSRGDRFAGAWYSSTNFVLDVNLVDGGTHRIALYCVDWNGQGGVQTIQVLDAGTGAILDAESLTGYSNGAYVVWEVAGHVDFSFTRGPTNLPPVLSGVFFDPPRSVPVVSLVSPANGSRFEQPPSIQLSALAAGASARLSRVEFLANGILLGVDPTGPSYTYVWPKPPPGTYSLTARAVDASGSNGVSAPITIAVESTGAGAWFAFSDTNSQGNWAGVYGQEGYVVAGDSTNTPTYALANVGSQLVIWATNTTDPRGLQRASGSSALSSAWYDFTNLVFDVEFTDATFHRLSLYSVDWLNLGGTETVDVLDFVSGRVLDHRLVQPFASGIFNVWDAQGHLGFRLTRPAGAPAMVSGLFFDVSPVLPSIIITNPPDGAFFAAPANITVTADSPADPIISRVDFYEGGSLVGSASNGPPYTFLWSNVPAGTRFLTAREVSKFGTADSAPIRLTIVASNVSVLAGPNLLADGSLQLNAFGPPGQPFRLEAATNLGPNAFWVPLATNTSGSNPFNFIVPDPTNYPQRFYRTVTLP